MLDLGLEGGVQQEGETGFIEVGKVVVEGVEVLKHLGGD